MKTLQSLECLYLRKKYTHDDVDIHIIQEGSLSKLVKNDLKISDDNQLFNFLALFYTKTFIDSVRFCLVIGCDARTPRKGSSNMFSWGEDKPTRSFHP